jgi:hypothetical protein
VILHWRLRNEERHKKPGINTFHGPTYQGHCPTLLVTRMECRRLQIRAKWSRFRGGRDGVGGPARCTSSNLCYSRDYSHMSTKSDAAKKVAGWCSDPQDRAPGTQGLEVPGGQENANRRATGDSAIDWIDHSAKLLPNFGRPIKALSIGCGFGPIGRILGPKHNSWRTN